MRTQSKFYMERDEKLGEMGLFCHCHIAEEAKKDEGLSRTLRVLWHVPGLPTGQGNLISIKEE